MERLNEIVDELLSNEVYDITEEIPVEEFAKAVVSAVLTMRIFEHCSVKLRGYQFKMGNRAKSVSCSDGCCTGVSHTEYKVYWEDDDDYNEDAVKNLAEMMNEAWYACVN